MIDDPLAGLEEVLVSVNFDQRMLGAYTEAMVREDFGEEHDTIKVYEGRAELLRDEELGSNVLRVRHPDGCVGPDACGMQFRVVLERAVEEAWISYKVKFESGFEWVRGGKLPGLCGAQCNGGCVSVSGSDGWSARMMWRREGELVQYMYYPGKSSNCGDDFSWGLRLETGRWMEVKTHIVMNTPGQNDGLVQSWLDGEEMLNRNVRYRNIEDIQIDRFYFSNFYGGEAADWAPSRDTFILYDDFVIATVDPATLPSSPEP